MEFRRYLTIFRRWFGIFILGGLIGAGIAYYFSNQQVKIYQSSTRVQVMSAPSAQGNIYEAVTDRNLAVTYTETIKTRPIIDMVEERLGIPISTSQIKPLMVGNTQLIDIVVQYTDPQHAANIANVLVDVFSEYNNKLQAERFEESEQSLKDQIAQVDAQIKQLQQQSEDISTTEKEDVISKAETEISRLEKEILALEIEIDTLTNRPIPKTWPRATPTILPEDNSKLIEDQLRLNKLRSTYNIYQQIYTNLSITGSSSGFNNNSSTNENLLNTLALYEQIRSNLLSSYESVRLARLSSTTNIVQIEPATVHSSPISPKVPEDTTYGAVAGLAVAALLVFLIEYLDMTFKTPDQITTLLGLPVMGYIMEIKRKRKPPFIIDNFRSPEAEAFRSLRTNVGYAAGGAPMKSLMIVSANPTEGKSTVASNLAVTFSHKKGVVLLVDADLRRPRVHKIFGLPNRLGLSDLLAGTAPVHEVIQRWQETNLAIITSGSLPKNAADLLSSDSLPKLLEFLKQNVDMIIVDAPPFLVADASILAAHVDGVLLVIRPGKTQIDTAVTTVEQLKLAGANILGAVMNRVPRRQSYYYGGYKYPSHYYSGGYYKHTDDEK